MTLKLQSTEPPTDANETAVQSPAAPAQEPGGQAAAQQPAAAPEKTTAPVKPTAPAANVQKLLQAAAKAAESADGGIVPPVATEQGDDEPPILMITRKEKLINAGNAAVAFGKKYKRIIAAAAVLLIMIPIVNGLYHRYIFGNGQDAFADKNYAQAVEYLNIYLEYDEGHVGAILMLVQSHIHQGDFAAAQNILLNVKQVDSGSDTPAELYLFLTLISVVEEEYQMAAEHLDNLFKEDPDSVPGHFMHAILNFYGEQNMQSVRVALDTARQKIEYLNAEEMTAAQQDISFIKRFIYSNRSAIVVEELLLPFDKLSMEEAVIELENAKDKLSISLSPEGFYNVYSIPTERKSLIEENLSIAENILLLQAAVAFIQREYEAMGAYLNEVESLQTEDAPPSLHYLYAKALLAARNGEYAQAAESYQKIRDRVINVDVNLMLAAALWADNGGGLPSNDIISLYEEVLEIQSDNVIALANFAHLQIYQQQLEPARDLLVHGLEIAPTNFHVVYNLSYLDIIKGEPLDRAEYNLYSLREVLPDSSILVLLLAKSLIAQGKYNQAINELNTAKDLISSSDIYLEIAALYRRREQPLLVLSELKAAHAAFPADRNVLFELALEYARHGEQESFRALIQDIPSEAILQDYRSLLAAAIVAEKREDAYHYYREALAHHPEADDQQREILDRWFRLVMDESDPAEAVKVFRAARSSFPDGLPLSFRIFEIWNQAMQADSALKEELRNDLLAFDLQLLSQEEKTDLALVLALLEDYQHAIEVLEPVAEESNAERLLAALKTFYTESGATQKAEAINRRILAVKENYARKAAEQQSAQEGQFAAADKLDFLYSASGEEKVFSSTGAKESDIPADEKTMSKQLESALEQKDYEQAIELYTGLLTTEGFVYTPAIVYQNRGVLYMNLSDYGNAVQDFEKALSLEGLKESDRTNVLYNYVLALAQNRQYKESAAAAEQLVEARSGDLASMVLYSRILSQARQYDKLITVYEEIIDVSPEAIGTYIQLAKTHRIQSNFEQALQVMKAALGIDPQHKAANRFIAQLYVELGDNKKAQEHIAIFKSL